MKPLLPLVGILAALSAPALAQAPDAGPAPFSDVRSDHWAAAAVGTLAVQGIFTGYPDGTFGGTRAITRYEFAVALDRVLDAVKKHYDAKAIYATAAPAAAPTLTPPLPLVPPEALSEVRRGQEQLRRDVSELQRRFGELREHAAGLRREVETLREQIGDVEPKTER